MRGQKVPFSVSLMTSLEIQNQIENYLNQNLDSESHFLVKVSITLGKVKESKIQVFMDSDQGITIAECVAYSRKLSKYLEENDPFENQYTLEVTSPGLDFPLSSDRQYLKNVNRTLHLELNDGKEITGKLIAYTPIQLELEVEEKQKGKKATLHLIQLPKTEIKKAKVTVSFK
ncbi:MAG TPA: ribosome maturation factor RimP [Catalimonadaceae bacterium]|nr:ribosome maturation factor RimP [Catalimonadaceae bacterium]